MNVTLSEKTHTPDVRPEIDRPRYLLGQVARAAGISAKTLKSWIERKIVVLGEHDWDSHGKGSSRVFTPRRVLAVTVIAELIKLGVYPHMASRMGPKFSDMALDRAKGDLRRVDDFVVLYPDEFREDRVFVGGDSYRSMVRQVSARTITEVLSNPKLDKAAASFILISMGALKDRVLERLASESGATHDG
jgi:hypothetical protein